MQHVRPATHLAFQAQELGITPTIWRTLCKTAQAKYDKLSGLDWEAWREATATYNKRGLSRMWSWHCRLAAEIIGTAIALDATGHTALEIEERCIPIALRNTAKPPGIDNNGRTKVGRTGMEARDRAIADRVRGEWQRIPMAAGGCKAQHCECNEAKGAGYVHCLLKGDTGCQDGCYCSQYDEALGAIQQAAEAVIDEASDGKERAAMEGVVAVAKAARVSAMVVAPQVVVKKSHHKRKATDKAPATECSEAPARKRKTAAKATTADQA